MATVNPASSLAIDRPSSSSKLVAHKPSPGFNVLAMVVIIVGIIYAGYPLADDLSVVHDTRAYPYIRLGIALVIGIGWKRIVVTVGERIGKTHLTYAQGASAPRTLIGSGRNNAGKPLRSPMVDRTQLADGLGTDAAGVYRAGSRYWLLLSFL